MGEIDRVALASQAARDRIGEVELVFDDQHAHPRMVLPAFIRALPADCFTAGNPPLEGAPVNEGVSNPGAAPDELAEQRELLEQALFEIKRVIAGQDAMLERVLVCLLAGGHL